MEAKQWPMLVERLPDAVYLIDPASSRIVWCNQRGLDDLQLQADEVINHSVLTLQKDVDGMPAWEDICQTIRELDVFTFVGRHQRKDGSEFPVEVNTSSFELDGKEYFVSVARDITRRRLLDDEVLARESKLWFALNEATDGLWDWNIVTGEVFFSPQLKRMLGYGPDEMTPHVDTWADNIHPHDVERVMRNLREHLQGERERYEAEYRLKNRNGHYLWVSDRGKVCERDAQGEPVRAVGMVQNITDRKAMEESLLQMASHDALTGLMNRRQGDLIFDKQLDLSQRLKLPMGVCLFDLDHFKQVNDRHGHLKGDEVLRTVVEIVQHNIRKSDHFYRWGGEEFVLVLPDTGPEQLIELAEKMRFGLQQYPWKQALGIEPVTASFGLAVYPGHGESAEQLLLNADTAMYSAKAQGRNRCVMASS